MCGVLIQYLDNPRWQISKIQKLNSFGHFNKHLVGEIQEKSQLLWPTLFTPAQTL
jgi:hypothetical protein